CRLQTSSDPCHRETAMGITSKELGGARGPCSAKADRSSSKISPRRRRSRPTVVSERHREAGRRNARKAQGRCLPRQTELWSLRRETQARRRNHQNQSLCQRSLLHALV